MSISRAALKLVLRQPVVLIVHLGLLGLIGVVLVQGLAKGAASGDVSAMRPTVAVVDRDDSELSRALAGYVESRGRPVDIGATGRDLQDAAATARVAYLAVIPEGYQADFIAAAADGAGSGQGGAPPKLQTAVTLESAASRYLSRVAETYVGLAWAALIAEGGGGDSVAEALARAERVSDVAAGQTVVAQPPARADASAFDACMGYATYPLTAGIVVLTGLIFHAFQTGELRRRNSAAPVSPARMTVSIAAAAIAVCGLAWAWISGLALVPSVGGLDVLALAPGQFALALAATLVYTAVPLALGFFAAQLGMGSTALNGFGTVIALAFAFLGGVFTVGLKANGLMAAIGLFVPTHWHGRAISAAGDVVGGAAGALGEYVGAIGVELLFAAVFAALGLLAGRLRMQTATAGGLALDAN
ncbi:MAG: ABC transporter permease [Bifidobacteriaceae bacterium]|jgi:ABC-2 type transport system permease protein|nr:ABC transporter permease [Bifidobacteriaceae bacterium]